MNGSELVDALLAGNHRALARAITKIENRAPGYRDLVAALYAHAGNAEVIGITGSPGAGKSTLVDKVAKAYRERGDTLGIVAVDPSSPYTGGAVLGDRIRMASTGGDMDTFVRSMSARGTLGGLSTATADAVTALDAFGKDRILVETVGAGQNEVDVVKTADTVVVLVQPGSGDDVQMLKAGILEIGDVFVVNKADLDAAARTVAELREMLHLRGDGRATRDRHRGHHGRGIGTGTAEPDGVDSDHGTNSVGPVANERVAAGDGTTPIDENGAGANRGESGGEDRWMPPVVETVATTGEGVDALLEAIAEHRAHLERTGALDRKRRERAAEAIRQQVRADVNRLVERELDASGGLDELARAVAAHDRDPYTVAAEVVAPIRNCVEEADRE